VGRISFENYGQLARELTDPTRLAGRYSIQAEAEKRILPDVIQKLQIASADRLLEIGCGAGNLLIPLSDLVTRAAGIDHPDCLAKLHERAAGRAIELLPGNFLELSFAGVFDKVLCYSVLHCLADRGEVLRFLDRALALLAPGGRALLGDIPNLSRKKRFLASRSGQEFQKDWEQAMKAAGETMPRVELAADSSLVQFDDELVLAMVARCRKQGLDAYVLPQPSDLPFGNTREDILAIRKL
jgi:2-polyprenyl-3-methyl-5-hydroxy-6-metoxy-1,4-benzoquinol methylase